MCNLLLLLMYRDATLLICSQKQFARAHSWVIAHPNAYSASKLRALLWYFFFSINTFGETSINMRDKFDLVDTWIFFCLIRVYLSVSADRNTFVFKVINSGHRVWWWTAPVVIRLIGGGVDWGRYKWGWCVQSKAVWPDGAPVIEMLSIKDICCGLEFVQRQLF